MTFGRKRSGAPRLGLQCGLALATLLSASGAHGARLARLIYERGPGAAQCPDEGALRTAVAARLGYDPFVAAAATLVTARVRRENEQFHTEVRLVDENGIDRGTRQMTTAGPDCADAISAMALTISLAIDPRSLTRPTPPPVETANRTQPESPPAPPPRAKSPFSPDGFFAGVSILSSFGMEVGPSGGLTLFAGAKWRALSLAIEGRADLPSSLALSFEGQRQVRSYALLAQIVPCAQLAMAFGCGLLSMGRMDAWASDVAISVDAPTLYLGLGVRGGVGMPLTSRLELRAYGDVLVRLQPHALTIDSARVYTYPPASADVNIASVLHF